MIVSLEDVGISWPPGEPRNNEEMVGGEMIYQDS